MEKNNNHSQENDILWLNFCGPNLSAVQEYARQKVAAHDIEIEFIKARIEFWQKRLDTTKEARDSLVSDFVDCGHGRPGGE